VTAVRSMAELGTIANVTDYVANGSFEALRLNVSYSVTPDHAVLVRLVDHNSGWSGPLTYVDKNSYEFLKKSSLDTGDVIVANVGANAGTVFRVPNLGMPTTLGPNAILCRPRDTDECDRGYLYYLLSSSVGQGLIAGIVSGSAQPKFNKTDFRKLQVSLPSIDDQRAIASILGAIDDKIEANHRTCSNLDALARAEVQGAQVRADDSLSLGDLVERVNDIVKPREFEAATVYVGLEHIPRGSLFLSEWGRSEFVASAKARFAAGDILFGKLRPYFKKVSIAPCPGVCSTDVFVLRPRRPEQSVLATVVCASDEVINYASAGSHGTRMPRVSWEYLSAWKVAVPGQEIVRALQQRLSPMLQLGVHVTYESVALAELRDTLLPKLLSGALRVRDAEPFVEAAV
jgi:type I restriction enzyme S subunit